MITPSENQNPGPTSESTSASALPACRWPIGFMKKEVYEKGTVLFKAKDAADKMYYVHRGAIRLVELNTIVPAGQVIGEMGIFSPSKERTSTAVCETDLEVYTMGREEVIRFFSQDPAMAVELIQLSIKRFIENLQAETAARERIESELRIAHEIQNSMLPSVFPQRAEVELYALMEPAKHVGGDFYDCFFVDSQHLCFLIGDVSGKGVPAALFMAITKTLLKNETKRGLPPDEALARVNNILVPENAACLFVTIFCAILDLETGEVEFASAGHNPPLFCDLDGHCDYLRIPAGFLVGVAEDSRCARQRLRLKPGEMIFLYTDGVTEAMNPAQELFSEDRLRSCLVAVKEKDIRETVDSIRQEVSRFAQSAPQSDDITIMAVRYRGNARA